MFNVDDCQEKIKLVGHTNCVHHIRFHPLSTISLPESGPNIVTASADKSIRLWNLVNTKSLELKGHTDRVNYAEFHPSGLFIASSSHDNTWKFWDL